MLGWFGLRIAAGVAVLVICATAQDRFVSSCNVRGQVSQPGATVLEGIVVELAGNAPDSLRLQAFPDARGYFGIEGVQAGDYVLSVTNMAGTVLQRKVVTVDSHGTFVAVEIPGRERTISAPGTVSVAALRHKVPAKAAREFHQASELAGRAQFEKAAEHLRKAIAIDGEYANAYADLGACYASLERLPEAREQFERALALDPDLATAKVNFAHVLLNMRRFAEAEQQARGALRLDPGSEEARYFLGAALAALHRGDAEALANLGPSAGRFPLARVYAADILSREGRRREAAVELRKYLASADVKNRQIFETWLKRLEQ
jgi:tetratricopeptide (TPR) repeat protein